MYNGIQENTHLYFFIARAAFWLRYARRAIRI